MHTKNVQLTTGFVPLMIVLAVAASCYVHTPDPASYQQVQDAERKILDSLLSDHDHVEEHNGQCMVKVMQSPGDASLALDTDALEAMDPLIIAAQYPLISPGYSYFTPLMYAIKVQFMPAVRAFLFVYDALSKDHKLEQVQFAIPATIQNTRPTNAGHTALLMGITSQNVDLVRVLVENGASISMHFAQAVGELGGSTPIHVGVATQNSWVLEAMLAGALQPANLEMQDAKNGSTPLDLSLSRSGRYIDVAKCLLKHGANPNSVDRTLGWRPLVRPILAKDLSMVELLLSYGANPYLVNYDIEGTPCLYRALVQVCAVRLDLVRLLFDYVVDACTTDAYGTEIKADINFRFKDGMTPLHVAVLQGDTELVRLILDLGSDVDPTDAVGNTPLHVAIAAPNHSIVEVLLRYGADVSMRDGYGRSPLELATDLDQVQAVKILIAHGAAKYMVGDYVTNFLDLMSSPSIQEIVLHLQSLLEPDRLARFTELKAQLRQNTHDLPTDFLDRLEAGYISALDNVTNPIEKTMLYWAAVRRETRLFQPLINMGANLNVRISVNSYTLLHNAVAEQRSLALVEKILSYPEINVNQRLEPDSYAPLHLAVMQQSDLSASAYDNLENILKCLLSFRKTNVNAQDSYGNTALHFAVRLNRPFMAKEILGHSLVCVNLRNNQGETPLHIALHQSIVGNDEMAKSSALQCVTLLLKHPRIDVNLRNGDGDAPLHMAVKASRTDLIQALLLHPKIDLNVKDSRGNTPSKSAAEIRFLSLVEQLLDLT